MMRVAQNNAEDANAVAELKSAINSEAVLNSEVHNDLKN